MNFSDFSQDEIERAARYHRPRYYLLFARAALTVLVVLLLRLVGRDLDVIGWAGAAVVWAALVVLALDLASLPLDVWSGYVRERAWGFSTQTLGGWLADQAKGLAVSVALSTLAWLGVVALGRALPTWWVVPAAAAAALVTAFLLFIAPIVLEPIFNTFRPLEDASLVARLLALAERAGAPVRQVLVADASRRTNKVNAYVSGLGASRRVVVLTTPHARDLPLAVLVLVAAQVVLAPPLAALSRRFERQADLFALRAIGELSTFEHVMTTISRRNLGDLRPPRLAYVFLFTHPTAPERLALARANA